jgi:hypothetical protein
MLQELTEIEQIVFNNFKGYKSSYRIEATIRATKLNETQIKEIWAILESKGYLKSNKAGHYAETAESQKQRLNGLTAKQYVEKAKAEQQYQNQQAFLNAFKTKLEKSME